MWRVDGAVVVARLFDSLARGEVWPGWRNWQTRKLEVLVPKYRACWFESSPGHSFCKSQLFGCDFFFALWGSPVCLKRERRLAR